MGDIGSNNGPDTEEMSNLPLWLDDIIRRNKSSQVDAWWVSVQYASVEYAFWFHHQLMHPSTLALSGAAAEAAV